MQGAKIDAIEPRDTLDCRPCERRQRCCDDQILCAATCNIIKTTPAMVGAFLDLSSKSRITKHGVRLKGYTLSCRIVYGDSCPIPKGGVDGRI